MGREHDKESDELALLSEVDRHRRQMLRYNSMVGVWISTVGVWISTVGVWITAVASVLNPVCTA